MYFITNQEIKKTPQMVFASNQVSHNPRIHLKNARNWQLYFGFQKHWFLNKSWIQQAWISQRTSGWRQSRFHEETVILMNSTTQIYFQNKSSNQINIAIAYLYASTHPCQLQPPLPQVDRGIAAWPCRLLRVSLLLHCNPRLLQCLYRQPEITHKYSIRKVYINDLKIANG